MLPLSLLLLSLAHVEAFVVTSHGQGLHVARQKLRNDTLAARHNGANASRFPAADRAGDLTCMRWTGGKCGFSSCKPERGPTVCEEGLCMCQPGTCAVADGSCQSDSEGKVIGDYAINFLKPYEGMQHKPYIGADAAVAGPGYIFGSAVIGHVAGLAGSASSEKQWRLILTSNGHVRLTNLHFPSSVLTFYMVNKDESLLQRRGALRVRNGSAIPDSDNVLPALVRLETLTPRQADFQVRPTHQDGGGLELWSPETKAALASGNPDGWFKDEVADAGVAECDVENLHRSAFWYGHCEGRQLVAFDPALPAEARMEGSRHYITQIAHLYGWQAFLIVCLIVACCVLHCKYGSPGDGPIFVGGGGGY